MIESKPHLWPFFTRDATITVLVASFKRAGRLPFALLMAAILWTQIAQGTASAESQQRPGRDYHILLDVSDGPSKLRESRGHKARGETEVFSPNPGVLRAALTIAAAIGPADRLRVLAFRGAELDLLHPLGRSDAETILARWSTPPSGGDRGERGCAAGLNELAVGVAASWGSSPRRQAAAMILSDRGCEEGAKGRLGRQIVAFARSHPDVPLLYIALGEKRIEPQSPLRAAQHRLSNLHILILPRAGSFNSDASRSLMRACAELLPLAMGYGEIREVRAGVRRFGGCLAGKSDQALFVTGGVDRRVLRLRGQGKEARNKRDRSGWGLVLPDYAAASEKDALLIGPVRGRTCPSSLRGDALWDDASQILEGSGFCFEARLFGTGCADRRPRVIIRDQRGAKVATFPLGPSADARTFHSDRPSWRCTSGDFSAQLVVETFPLGRGDVALTPPRTFRCSPCRVSDDWIRRITLGWCSSEQPRDLNLPLEGSCPAGTPIDTPHLTGPHANCLRLQLAESAEARGQTRREVPLTLTFDPWARGCELSAEVTVLSVSAARPDGTTLPNTHLELMIEGGGIRALLFERPSAKRGQFRALPTWNSCPGAAHFTHLRLQNRGRCPLPLASIEVTVFGTKDGPQTFTLRPIDPLPVRYTPRLGETQWLDPGVSLALVSTETLASPCPGSGGGSLSFTARAFSPVLGASVQQRGEISRAQPWMTASWWRCRGDRWMRGMAFVIGVLLLLIALLTFGIRRDWTSSPRLRRGRVVVVVLSVAVVIVMGALFWLSERCGGA